MNGLAVLPSLIAGWIIALRPGKIEAGLSRKFAVIGIGVIAGMTISWMIVTQFFHQANKE